MKKLISIIEASKKASIYLLYYMFNVVLCVHVHYLCSHCACIIAVNNYARPLQGDSYDVDMIVRRLEIEGHLTN